MAVSLLDPHMNRKNYYTLIIRIKLNPSPQVRWPVTNNPPTTIKKNRDYHGSLDTSALQI